MDDAHRPDLPTMPDHVHQAIECYTRANEHQRLQSIIVVREWAASLVETASRCGGTHNTTMNNTNNYYWPEKRCQELTLGQFEVTSSSDNVVNGASLNGSKDPAAMAESFAKEAAVSANMAQVAAKEAANSAALLTSTNVVGATKEKSSGNSIPAAVDALRDIVRKCPDYLWSWHCNLAMAAHDEGLSHAASQRASARFIQSFFGVDMRDHPHWEKGWDGPSSAAEAKLGAAAQATREFAQAVNKATPHADFKEVEYMAQNIFMRMLAESSPTHMSPAEIASKAFRLAQAFYEESRELKDRG